MKKEPNDLIKQRAKYLFEHLNMFDWKLGISGTNDDKYFIKLENHIFKTLETNDLSKIKLLQDKLDIIQGCVKKSDALYKYEHIFNEVKG